MTLSALLSQILVAFTLEFDNEFEFQMIRSGYPGATMSRIVWASVIRHISLNGSSVRVLAEESLSPLPHLKHQLGCLERWGCIKLTAQSASLGKRDGWGSGRGVNSNCTMTLTQKGVVSREVWLPLTEKIEQRWLARFGQEVLSSLRDGLKMIALKTELQGPDPSDHTSIAKGRPRPAGPTVDDADLPTLLSWVLQMFQVEFDHESSVPFELCANTIRVLGIQPIKESEIPRLTGTSPETSGIGWQVKPYVIIEPDPGAKRGKLIRLSERGIAAQGVYHKLLGVIEARWRERFGASAFDSLSLALVSLYEIGDDGKPRICECLTPHQGTARSGKPSAALGRKEIGPAARQRARDIVAQTQEFLRDPAGTLPHFPLWDMNRGFGP